MRLIVVSGLAGAGKTVVLKMLEDLGYHCIDNLPLALLHEASVSTLNRRDFDRMAVGIDTRAQQSELAAFGERIAALRASGIDVQVIYLYAGDDVILRRFSETRRKHPLTDAHTALADAIDTDRRLLEPVAGHADITIDSSDTNLHQLRDLIRNNVEATAGQLSILLQSFGFKHGVPRAVDFVFDVRCLPNPHWIPALREYTGRQQPVIDYLEDQPQTGHMLDDLDTFLSRWLPEFARENRAYVMIAVGCTGGRHRSVYVVEQLAERLRPAHPGILVRHNEIP